MNKSLLIYISLAAVTFAVYLPVRGFDYINFDDYGYVAENDNIHEISLKSISWAFTSSYASNWHPLTWLSHMLDWQLFGNNPGAHHVVNLVLHVVNTCLLFYMLKVMTGAVWPCAFVAAAFALHPLHVESVAWISERKDVLSTMFWFLTTIAYVAYVKKGGAGRYALALVLFALGLMAKPMLVTLPFVLLLVDFWPLGRCSSLVSRRSMFSGIFPLVVEKATFFVLSAASSVITFLAQRNWGSVAGINQLNLPARLANACSSYFRYIGKAIWPSDLCVFYPHADKGVSIGLGVVAGGLLAAITIVILLLARRRGYIPVGWLWYLGTLVPVIGIVQVGGLAMANRYTYIPLTGLFVIAAWGAKDIIERAPKLRNIIVSCALAIIGAWAWRTGAEVSYWRNSETLFKRAIEVTEGNYAAYYGMVKPLRKEGRIDQAMHYCRQAVITGQNFEPAHTMMGIMLIDRGKAVEAIGYLKRAVAIDPGSAEAHAHLGRALAVLGEGRRAVEHFRQALNLRPGWAEPANSLAWLLATDPDETVRDGSEAVNYAKRACELTGYETPSLVDTLACAYATAGRFDEAVKMIDKAIELARRQGEDQMVSQFEARLELFKKGQVYVESSNLD